MSNNLEQEVLQDFDSACAFYNFRCQVDFLNSPPGRNQVTITRQDGSKIASVRFYKDGEKFIFLLIDTGCGKTYSPCQAVKIISFMHSDEPINQYLAINPAQY